MLMTGATDAFEARTDRGPVPARWVVVASGACVTPHLPAVAQQLSPGVQQFATARYCRPSRLPDGPVGVVGGGNSAARLACELASARDMTLVSSRRRWFVPKSIAGARVYCWLYPPAC